MRSKEVLCVAFAPVAILISWLDQKVRSSSYLYALYAAILAKRA